MHVETAIVVLVLATFISAFGWMLRMVMGLRRDVDRLHDKMGIMLALWGQPKDQLDTELRVRGGGGVGTGAAKK